MRWSKHKSRKSEKEREGEKFILEAKDHGLSISLAGNKAWNSIIMLPGNLGNIVLIKQKLSGVNSWWMAEKHYIIISFCIPPLSH